LARGEPDDEFGTKLPAVVLYEVAVYCENVVSPKIAYLKRFPAPIPHACIFVNNYEFVPLLCNELYSVLANEPEASNQVRVVDLEFLPDLLLEQILRRDGRRCCRLIPGSFLIRSQTAKINADGKGAQHKHHD
jgi:hypothetical protein